MRHGFGISVGDEFPARMPRVRRADPTVLDDAIMHHRLLGGMGMALAVRPAIGSQQVCPMPMMPGKGGPEPTLREVAEFAPGAARSAVHQSRNAGRINSRYSGVFQPVEKQRRNFLPIMPTMPHVLTHLSIYLSPACFTARNFCNPAGLRSSVCVRPAAAQRVREHLG